MRAGELGRSSRVFAALSSPARLQILELLDKRQICVCELVPRLRISQPTVSYHVRLMADVGLIRTRKKGTKVYCRARRAVARRVRALANVTRRAQR